MKQGWDHFKADDAIIMATEDSQGSPALSHLRDIHNLNLHIFPSHSIPLVKSTASSFQSSQWESVF